MATRYDYIDLGPVPFKEDSLQYRPNYNPEKAWEECNRYKEFLSRMFPIPKHLKKDVKLKVQAIPTTTESRPYFEVNIVFPDKNPEALDFAILVESRLPATWAG